MKRLIINADDFGWSDGINRGIIDAFEKGVVTSASLMANGAAFEDAVIRAKNHPRLGVGVHLNVYRLRPTLPTERVKSLINSDGQFLASVPAVVWRLLTNRFQLTEVEAEFRNQIELVLKTGLKPDHLNTEKHLHMWPSLFQIVIRLAQEYRIPAVRRVKEPLSFSKSFLLTLLGNYNSRFITKSVHAPQGSLGVAVQPVSLENFRSILSAVPDGITELVTHPGYLSDQFWQQQKPGHATAMVYSREQELAILADPDARVLCQRAGIELVNFHSAYAA